MLAPVTEPKRKSEVFELLKPISKEEIRPEMIEVIKLNRRCSEKQAKDVKTLYPSEVEEVLKRFA
jgi:hypothetical protein